MNPTPTFTFRLPGEPYIEEEEEEIVTLPKKPTFTFREAILEPKKEETLAQNVGRQIGRTALRVGETAGGIAGDIYEFGSTLGDYLTKPFFPEEVQQQAKQLREQSRFLPKGSELQEISEKTLGKFAEAQNEYEQLGDEIAKDFTALLVPVGGKMSPTRALGTSLLGNLSAETLKSFGFSPTSQLAGKIGGMFLAGLVGRQGAKNYVSDLYNEAYSAIPEGETIEAGNLLNTLDKMTHELGVGGITDQKKPALRLAQQLRSKIIRGRGELEARELPAFRQSANEIRYTRDISDRGRYFVDRFDDVVSNSLMEYGEQNPTFLNRYKEANVGFAGLQKSNKLAREIQKKVDVTKLKPETFIAIGAHAAAQNLSPGILGITGGIAATATGLKILKRIYSNPTLRHYYTQIWKDAFSENYPAMIKNIEKLDEKIE